MSGRWAFLWRLAFIWNVFFLPLYIRAHGEDPAALIKSCWNEKYNATPRGFMGYVHGESTRAYLADVWWSKRPSKMLLTIYTMASIDRLSMIESQCMDYRGPLSAAIYVGVTVGPQVRRASRRLHQQQQQQQANVALGQPAVNSDIAVVEAAHPELLSQARAQLQAFFNKIEGMRAANPSCCCELRLSLFLERTADPQLAAIMPTNVMRNAAMLAVQTPLATMLDADLAVNKNFSNLASDINWILNVMDPTGTGMPSLGILPAWEPQQTLDNTTAYGIVRDVQSATKDQMAAMWANRKIEVFHAENCKICHMYTKHDEWLKTKSQFFVDFASHFEPWGIIKRETDPGYDERFRGWCYDKMQHVEAMARLRRYRMVVLPDAWVIHRPHPRVALAALTLKDKGLLNQTDNEVNKVDKVNVMMKLVPLPNGTMVTAYRRYMDYVRLRYRMEEKEKEATDYHPQLNQQYRNCRRLLPWWHGAWWPSLWGPAVGGVAGPRGGVFHG